jgi:flagellar hook-basal body complex protein FliE
MKKIVVISMLLGSVSVFSQANPNDTEYGRCFVDTVTEVQTVRTVADPLFEAISKGDEKRIQEIMLKTGKLAEVVCKGKSKTK